MKCIAALLAIVAVCHANFTVPLRRVDSHRISLIKTGQYEDYLKFRTRQSVLNTFTAGVGKALITDYDDASYLMEIELGTPGQKFTIVPDTGSSNLWIPDSTCGHASSATCSSYACRSARLCDFACEDTSCCAMLGREWHPRGFHIGQYAENADPCTGKNTFDSSASSTYVKDGRPFSMSYGTGSCSGFLGKDVAKVAGITVQNQIFGQASTLASFFGGKPLDGIMGLGYPEISADQVPPVLVNMIDQKLIDQPIFTVYMAKTNDNKHAEHAGEITFGSIDKTRYTGDITYFPVTRKGYWQMSMQSIRVNGQEFKNSYGDYAVISDTGTSFAIGPVDAIQGIAAAVGAEYSRGAYLMDCSREGKPDIEFVFGGKSFAVGPDSYILKLTDTLCMLAFAPQGRANGVDWILGDTFIRDWYQIYDYGNDRVGFAKAVHKL